MQEQAKNGQAGDQRHERRQYDALFTIDAARLREDMADRRLRARAHTREYGEDPIEIRDWAWSY